MPFYINDKQIRLMSAWNEVPQEEQGGSDASKVQYRAIKTTEAEITTFAQGKIKYVYGKHAAGVKDIASNRTRGQLWMWIYFLFLGKSVYVITLILQEISTLQSIIIYWPYSCATVENKQDLYSLSVEASLSIHNMQILRPSSRMLDILTHSQRPEALWFHAILMR